MISRWFGSRGKYIRPFPSTVPELQETGSSAHVGKDRFAIDFLVPEGTYVLAPRDGVVIKAKDDSDRGGSSRRFENDANFLILQHEDGERSVLIHLKKDSIRVKLGEWVRAGDVVAQQGSTGWTYKPHIHFAVYRDGTSVKIKFR